MVGGDGHIGLTANEGSHASKKFAGGVFEKDGDKRVAMRLVGDDARSVQTLSFLN